MRPIRNRKKLVRFQLGAYRTADGGDYTRAWRNLVDAPRLERDGHSDHGGSSPLARTNFLVDTLSMLSYKPIYHQQTQRTPNYEPSYQAN